jgi:signal transduction histidine kinase
MLETVQLVAVITEVDGSISLCNDYLVTLSGYAEHALRESEERRRLVMAEMLRTAEEERSRIATELHDDTVQVMAATLMSLDRVKAAIERDARAQVQDAVCAARSTLAAAAVRTRAGADGPPVLPGAAAAEGGPPRLATTSSPCLTGIDQHAASPASRASSA